MSIGLIKQGNSGVFSLPSGSSSSETELQLSSNSWTSLRRWLFTGSVSSLITAPVKISASEVSSFIDFFIKEDATKTLNETVSVLKQSRLSRREFAIFSLAKLCAHPPLASEAWSEVSNLILQSRDLFSLVQALHFFSKWDDSVKNGLASWYSDQDEDYLAYEILRRRSGKERWSHKELIEFCNPKTANAKKESLFRWVLEDAGYRDKDASTLPGAVLVYEALQKAPSTKEALEILSLGVKIPYRAVPPRFRNDSSVVEKLLPHMTFSEILDQLGPLTGAGLLNSGSSLKTKIVCCLTEDPSSRHPLELLLRLCEYQQGFSDKSSTVWAFDDVIAEALTKAVRQSFRTYHKKRKLSRTLVYVDTSSSMKVSGLRNREGMPPQVLAANLCYYAKEASTECYVLTGLDDLSPDWKETTGVHYLGGSELSAVGRIDTDLFEVPSDVVKRFNAIPGGQFDYTAPILYAQSKGLEVDNFLLITDYEHHREPYTLKSRLAEYRAKTGIMAGLAVLGLSSSEFSLADPSDPGMIDFAGFDSSTPYLLDLFLRGEM